MDNTDAYIRYKINYTLNATLQIAFPAMAMVWFIDL